LSLVSGSVVLNGTLFIIAMDKLCVFACDLAYIPTSQEFLNNGSPDEMPQFDRTPVI
jgi:hypothetical protein